MSDTPRTDAAECRLRYYETRCGDRYEETLTYIEPEHARTLERELAAVTAERDALQAQVDALMLEYCPLEMTIDQKARWANNQRKACPSATETR